VTPVRGWEDFSVRVSDVFAEFAKQRLQLSHPGFKFGFRIVVEVRPAEEVQSGVVGFASIRSIASHLFWVASGLGDIAESYAGGEFDQQELDLVLFELCS
jgi:hypothetical protein